MAAIVVRVTPALIACFAVTLLAAASPALASWPNLPEQTVFLSAEGARGRALQQTVSPARD